MIKIYTDGGSRGNPGPGGFGVVGIVDNTILFSHQELFEENVTNNQMELKAILYALKYMEERYPEEAFIIYSDSRYCVSMCNEWIFDWVINNWKNSKKEEVKNLDLVKELYNYVSLDFPNFRIEKCSGHASIFGNELADALATNNKAKFEKILKDNHIENHYLIF